MNVYCQNCGQLHKYTSQKPNFCTKCGTGMNSVANTQKNEALEVEEETEGTIPENKQQLVDSIEALSYECDNFTARRTNKLGSIAGSYASNPDGTRIKSEPAPKAKRVTKKAFMEEFKREAGSIRSNKQSDA